MVLGMTSLGMATTATGVDGSITIGTLAIDLSAKGVSSYSSEVAAGGYGGAAAGDQWAITTGSTAGNAVIALEFIMRGSAALEDNNLYQHLVGSLPAAASDLSAPTFDPSSAAGWSVRGGH